jgi:hypothetical protein
MKEFVAGESREENMLWIRNGLGVARRLAPHSLLAALCACSAASQAVPPEPVASTKEALDPNQVVTATRYTITLSEVDVLKADDAFDPYSATGGDGLTRHQPDAQTCSYDWTPDNGFVDWAALGVQINSDSPSTQACVLGQSNGSPSAATGSVLTQCVAGAYQNNLFFQGQALSIPFFMNGPNDSLKVALALDNIESTDPNTLVGADWSPQGFSVTGDSLGGVGAVVSALGGAAGPVGAALGVVGGLLSVIGDVTPPANQLNCGTLNEVSCAGGLMGSPPPAIKSPCIMPYPIPPSCYPGPPPDTVFMSLTSQQLQYGTADAPLAIDLYPVMNAGNSAGASVYVDGSSGITDVGCYSSLHVRLTIARDWSTGPASSARNGDIGASRAPGTIDAVAVDSTAPTQIVHHWGSGSGFGSEFENAAQSLESGSVTINTAPVVVDRSVYNDDIFWSGSNGGLYTTYQASPDFAWHAMNIIGPYSFVPANAALAATARSPDNLDVFFIGNEGDVHNAYWNTSMGTDSSGNPVWGSLDVATSGGCYGTTASCTGSGVPGGAVAVVSRIPTHLDVFYVGRDGGIWSSWWDASSGWYTDEVYGPSSTLQPGSAIAPPGGRITATARTSQNLDVFFVANDGGLGTSAWSTGGNWGTWEIAGTGGLGQPGAQIAAVARQPEMLDVAWGAASSGIEWSNWGPHGWDTVVNPTGSQMTTSGQYGSGGISLVAPSSFGLQLFYIDASHQLNTAYWNDPTQCDGLLPQGCTSNPTDFQWQGPWTLGAP